MTSLEESSAKIQLIEELQLVEYTPFMLTPPNSSIVDEEISYINELYKHFSQNQILKDLALPTIPYFNSQQSYFDFVNYSKHKFNLLNAYIYVFKRHLIANNINDPNINYVNSQLLTPLCRGCNCNSVNWKTCSICVSNYKSYIVRLKPEIIKYIRNYPLLDIVLNYPNDNTNNHDLNTYILKFNQEFNTDIPTVLQLD